LLDNNDDYDEILFNEQKKIVLKDGEYVFAIPEPLEVVADQSSLDTGDVDQQIV